MTDEYKVLDDSCGIVWSLSWCTCLMRRTCRTSVWYIFASRTMYVQKLPIIIITLKKNHVNLVFVINFLWYPTLRTSISLSWMSHLLVNSLGLWLWCSFFFFMFCPKIRFVSLGLPHTWTQVRFHLDHLIFYPLFF